MTPAQHYATILMQRLGIPPEAVGQIVHATGRKPTVRRVEAYARARDKLAYAMRHEPPPGHSFSFWEIAEALGWRSHATAVEAIRREQARRVAAKAIGGSSDR